MVQQAGPPAEVMLMVKEQDEPPADVVLVVGGQAEPPADVVLVMLLKVLAAMGLENVQTPQQ